jgi:hypothetical protein
MSGGQLYALAADLDQGDHHAHGFGAHGLLLGWGRALRAADDAGHGLGLAFAMPITLFLVPLDTLFVEDDKRGFAKMLRRSSAKDHQPNDGKAADGL